MYQDRTKILTVTLVTAACCKSAGLVQDAPSKYTPANRERELKNGSKAYDFVTFLCALPTFFEPSTVFRLLLYPPRHLSHKEV